MPNLNGGFNRRILAAIPVMLLGVSGIIQSANATTTRPYQPVCCHYEIDGDDDIYDCGTGETYRDQRNCPNGYIEHTVTVCGGETLVYRLCNLEVGIICIAGTYKSGNTCVTCPSPGTSDDGATAITDCYTPAQTGTDTYGTYTIPKCYYTN